MWRWFVRPGGELLGTPQDFATVRVDESSDSLLWPDGLFHLHGEGLYDRYLTQAEAHLSAGWVYTNTLPKRCVRVRLACAWPILIGMQTVAKLRTGNVLDPQQRIKVSRPEVKSLMLRSILYYPWPPAWRRLFPSPG